jgi:hypothetical protein
VKRVDIFFSFLTLEEMVLVFQMSVDVLWQRGKYGLARKIKDTFKGKAWWLISVIPATWVMKIGRIKIQDQLKQNINNRAYLKIYYTKYSWGLKC